MQTKPYPKYKTSGVEWLGDVPAHWGAKRFGYLFRFFSGGTPSTSESELWDGELPWVSSKDMKSMVVSDTEDHISEEAVRQSATCKLPAGSLLMVNRSGILKHSIPVAIITREMAINQDIRGCVPLSTVDSKFIAYLIAGNQPALLALWRQQGATVESLTFESVKTTNLHLPDPAEQRAIAVFLDRETGRVDQLVAKKRELIERLKEKRAALISQTVTRGLPPAAARAAGLPTAPPLKPSGVEWLGEIPKHWEVMSLFRIAETIQTGPFGSQLHSADYVEGGIPLINPAHIIASRLVPDELSAVDRSTALRLTRHRLRFGDIIMARRGEIGRCAVVGRNEVGWLCGTGSLVVRLRECNSTYFATIFSDAGFRGMLELHAVGTTMLNLNPTIVGRMLAPVPPLPEQAAIAEYLDVETAKLDALVAKVEEAVERLLEYRTALITAAVTGKMDVRKGGQV